MSRAHLGPVVQVARLESRFVLRNRTARYYMISANVVVAALSGLMVHFPGPEATVTDILYVASLYAPLTYALLGFSWNATNGAVLFTLPVAPKHQLAGKLLVASGLTLPASAILVAFCMIWRPGLALMPILSGWYAVAVFAIPCLIVSASVPRNLDANARPLSDWRRFGWQHHAAGAAAIVPVWIASKMMAYDRLIICLGTATVLAVAVLPLVLKRTSAVLEKGIPKLSERLIDG